MWAFAVLALILWMLGRAFLFLGVFVHTLLVAALVLLVLNFVRVSSFGRPRIRDVGG